MTHPTTNAYKLNFSGITCTLCELRGHSQDEAQYLLVKNHVLTIWLCPSHYNDQTIVDHTQLAFHGLLNNINPNFINQ